MTMEPSESALRVLSTMFDTVGGDEEHGHHASHKIGASRPAEDCGCHSETRMVPMRSS
jgi:hypothetical protein